MNGRNKENLTGQKFERLLAIKDSGKRDARGGVIWICLCNCGNYTEVRATNLKTGNTKACGCLSKEMLDKHRIYKHGEAFGKNKTKLYCIWDSMKQRCYNPKNRAYKWYGSKGIKICDEWMGNYSAFKFWAILNGYQDNLTIDRIDSNNGYNPNNCQWITGSENARKGAKERWRKNK